MSNSKIGLDYFEHYIGMTNDEKTADLRMNYGSVAIDVWLTLLDLIYSDKGYYIEYGSTKTKKRVVWKILGVVRGKYPPTPDTVSAIIENLVACELFSGDLFKSGILSSKRIQEQYYKATAERKSIEVDPDIWLLSIERMKKLSEKSSILSFLQNRPVLAQNRPIMNENRTIIKQSKEEQRRGEESRVPDAPAPDKIFELFNRICVSFPKVTYRSDARINAVQERINAGAGLETFEQLFRKAEKSRFLKGKNKKGWSANFDWIVRDGNMAKILDGNYDDAVKEQKYSYDLDDYKALVNNFGGDVSERKTKY